MVDRSLYVLGSPIFWAILALGLVAGGVYVYRQRERPEAGGSGTVQWATDNEPTHGGAFFPGTAGGRFNIQKPLGAGGFGRTYLATDTVIDRDVVLKEIAEDADREEVLKEARAGGALNHPNVVTVHDVIEDNGNAYVVLEYVAGGTLAQRLEDGPLPATDALDIMDGVLSGLSALHEKAVIHRDIKPSNILLATDGQAKLTDFGLAVPAGTDHVAGVGTPRFMAPEQLRGGTATERSDIYQVATVLYHALTGGHHLGLEPGAGLADAEAVLAKDPLLPVQGVPPELAPVLKKAFVVDPDKRYASADAMREAIQRARKALGE